MVDAVRRQLGVGIDPGYDYSQMAQSQRKMAQKEKKPKEDATGAISGIDQLRKALREVVGGAP